MKIKDKKKIEKKLNKKIESSNCNYFIEKIEENIEIEKKYIIVDSTSKNLIGGTITAEKLEKKKTYKIFKNTVFIKDFQVDSIILLEKIVRLRNSNSMVVLSQIL